MSMADVQILKPKIEASGILEIVGIGAAKILQEKMTAPYIGNGSIQSALVKGVLGGLAHSYVPAGALRTIVSGAFLVDAGEDAATSLLGISGMGAASQTGGVDW